MHRLDFLSRDPDLKAKSEQALTEKITLISYNLQQLEANPTQYHLDQIYNALSRSIYLAAKEHIGRKSCVTGYRNPLRVKFNESMLVIQQRIRENIRSIERYRYNTRLKAALLEENKPLRKELRRLISKARKELHQRYIEELENLPPDRQLKILRSINKNRTRTKTHQNEPIDLQKFKEFYYNRFDHTHTRPCDTPLSSELSMDPQEQPPITLKELEKELNRMPNSKAPGYSKIPIEFVKLWRKPLLPTVLRIFNTILRSYTAPSAWNLVLLYPIYKGKDDSQDPQNYRPIALTEHLRKLFEKLLKSRITSYDLKIHTLQNGFQEKKSTLDHCTTLDYLLAATPTRRSRVTCFLDIKGAFDTVDRTLLWHKCRKILPSNIITLLQYMFDHNCFRIISKDSRSSWFDSRAGVLQGSVLSPLLYTIYINDLAKNIKAANLDLPTIPSGSQDTPVECFLFADDISSSCKVPSRPPNYG